MSQLISAVIANPMTYLIYLAAIVFVFGLIIFIHEFGHFLVAKKIGVRVEQFSFGFGGEIFGFKWGETRYTVNWIPLGGYVRMSGEMPEDYQGPKLEGTSQPTESHDRSRDFLAQPWYMRILVALAGPVMNYALAAVLFFAILVIWGEPNNHLNKTEIGSIIVGSPAAQAGLQLGDVVLKVDGQPVEDFLAVKDAIKTKPRQKVVVEIKRGDDIRVFNVTPAPDPSNPVEGIIGIRPAKPIFDHKKVGVISAIGKSFRQCWNVTYATVYYLGHAITARVKPDVAGPVGITKVIVDSVKSGMEDYIYILAMISLAVGLFNLFPIPMLDGSHVVYYSLEAIRGKPLSTKTLNTINVVGFALLMALMVFATMNDFQRLKADGAKANQTQSK